MQTKKVRTRYAPSPTGYLHVGGLRTALYNFLVAKKAGGDYLIRLEDTDQSRIVEGSDFNLVKSLHEVGIVNNEGLTIVDDNLTEVGDLGPYTQSKRLDIYKKYANQLIEQGNAYYSFRTPEEIDVIRARCAEKHRPLKEKDLDEHYTKEEIEEKLKAGTPHTVRLRVPYEGSVTFNDLVRGEVTFNYADVDDQILIKSDGFPTYHLALVVDDHLMQISHTIRGEEWVSSTPKHLFLYQCFGWEPPVFAHLPLLLNPDKTKLSKRQGDVALSDYLDKGYLPEVMVNFVALLGWNPGSGETQELYTLEELVKIFDLNKVHKAGAVFDLNKLNWMNAKYLREKISVEKFIELITPWIEKAHFDKLLAIKADKTRWLYLIRLIRERIERLDQVETFFKEQAWLDAPAVYDESLLAWKKSTLDDAKIKLSELNKFLVQLDDADFNDVKTLEDKIKNWITEKGFGTGDVLWPMRVALTGQEKSPNPFEVAYLLGKEESIRRISKIK